MKAKGTLVFSHQL